MVRVLSVGELVDAYVSALSVGEFVGALVGDMAGVLSVGEFVGALVGLFWCARSVPRQGVIL